MAAPGIFQPDTPQPALTYSGVPSDLRPTSDTASTPPLTLKRKPTGRSSLVVWPLISFLVTLVRLALLLSGVSVHSTPLTSVNFRPLTR
ncbi:hypothetical protein D9M73_298990 [compost metagenome]